MTTKRFEEILRQKLESLKPDFQLRDWDKFQAFQQQAAPSFWQTYGHWLGYAVAVIATGVMVTLYVSQSQQNDALLREMKELREQVASGTVGAAAAIQPTVTNESTTSGEPAPPARPRGGSSVPYSDTVYIIEPRVIYRDRPYYENRAERTQLTESSRARESLNLAENLDRQKSENPEKPVAINIIKEKSAEELPPTVIENNVWPKKIEIVRKGAVEESPIASPILTDNQWQATLPQDRLIFDSIQFLPSPSMPETSKTEYGRLMHRMPKRPVQKQAVPILAKSRKAGEKRSGLLKPHIGENIEKATKEESLFPKFGLNLPFRVGAGQEWEGRTKAFSLWNQVLLGEHWSVQAGLSWQKLEDQKFFDERGFRERMRKDFRKNHAEKLPPSFDIFNISTSTKITRIPLNLTYRNEISHGFSYFVGAGTNVNLRARQTLSFDFKRPTRDYGQATNERNIPFPLINDVNALVGLEKRLSPIVLQVSSLLNTRFNTYPFLENRTDMGIRITLFCEFNPAKKK